MVDSQVWRAALRNYWSLLTPLIFSDHPKRPGDEDPSPPSNMLRNVMDMNAQYGGLNAAFLEENKLVWVMNVVPVNAPNTLPLILDRGFAGVLHDWYVVPSINENFFELVSNKKDLKSMFLIFSKKTKE